MRIIPTVFAALLLSAVLVSSNGCTTYNTVQYAKGYPENTMWFSFNTRGSKPKEPGDHESHPAYYALTPLAVPVDVVTFPFQFVYFWYVLLSGFGSQ
jgi:hypothetical protein